MKLSWLLVLLFSGLEVNSAAILSREIHESFAVGDENGEFPTDYRKLVHFAGLASYAYCIQHGLTTGKLGARNSHCPLVKCNYKQYKDIEIKRTFNYNDWGEVGSGYFAIDHNSKRLIMVFRGTASTTDWISNLDFVPVKYKPLSSTEEFSKITVKDTTCKGCTVHRGFYNFLRRNSGELIEGVLSQIKKYPDYQLVIVGHSMGAALSTLTGIEFSLLGYDPLVVSFGAPKVGNKKFAQFSDKIFNTEGISDKIYNKQDFDRGLIRVVHYNDVVPTLPPTKAFHHSGFQYYIDKRDIPHKPQYLVRRGLEKRDLEEDSESDSDTEIEEVEEEVEDIEESYDPNAPVNATSFRYGNTKLWPEYFGKYEHTYYFIKISGCNPEKETF
ncbi:triacylglycerol lipase precursor [Scheffersomyces amazonensis]|uniref:triacylglycerol lipase precursor n=1 Tax=Scheffersomyces amazonensis TaxID=1078765 RepID=UPI00315D9747